MLFSSLVTIVPIACAAAPASSPSELQSILANPQAYDGKRVTVTGLAEIGGAEFSLYPDERSQRTVGKAAFIWLDSNGPRYDRFNGYWMKVTGIVEARRHGPFNTDPCEIKLEHFELLTKAPLKDTRIYGIFRNDTSTPVNVRIYRPDGYSDFGVPPGTTSTEGIEQHSSAVVTSLSGKLIAKVDLLPPKAQAQYFDPVNRSYYYRIADSKIEPVPPRETKTWKIYRP
jgi:hypothetical protein